MPVSRTQTLVQRAYVYIVALVAIHMVVLGVANLLRVLAEIALAAPSGGFTGLPFLFNDFSRAREVYREQASLAIALLAVGAPAWWIHYRMARRAASIADERGSAVRSAYVHIVVFVTALLVFGYGQRALSLVLQGTTFASAEADAFFGLRDSAWPARAAGAAAMAAAAAIALVFHLRISLEDRRIAPHAERAGVIRHLALYGLLVIGVLYACLTASTMLQEIWQRVADTVAPPSGIPQPVPPPGVPPTRPPVPSRDDFLRFQLTGELPAALAGIVLWLLTWASLQRGLVSGPDVEIERRSIVRKIAIYLIVFLAAVVTLIGVTTALASVAARLLGDPVVGAYTSLWRELAGPVTGTLVFAPLWLFQRRVVESEASRESEVVRAATIRRLYTYLICAIGLGMTAVGAAGTLGVIGSALLGLNTHANAETGVYLALALIGPAAWWSHWRAARARLDDDERRSLPRRLYLYLAILGGVIGLLVFGSAALYRVLNALLALSFARETGHDLWHFLVDAVVAAAVAYVSYRALRADRSVLAATGEETYAVTVLVRAADRDAARTRVANALASAPDVTIRR